RTYSKNFRHQSSDCRWGSERHRCLRHFTVCSGSSRTGGSSGRISWYSATIFFTGHRGMPSSESGSAGSGDKSTIVDSIGDGDGDGDGALLDSASSMPLAPSGTAASLLE